MKFIVILSFFLICSASLPGQQSIKPLIEVSESEVVFLGKSKEVRDIPSNAKGTTRYAKEEKFKKQRKIPDNFKGRRGHSKSIIPELEHLGPDPLRQLTSRNGTIVEPKVNIIGIGGNGSPHDPTGDVGMDYYIQAVNVTKVGIFSKDGNLIKEFPMNELWSSLGANSFGDPIVLYDEIEKRWIITEFTGPSNLLIAVSETADPFGSFYAYSFSTPRFPDYPKYAIWGDIITVTTNEQGAGTLHHYFLDKQALYNGSGDAKMQRIAVSGNSNTTAGFFVATPVDADGYLLPENPAPISMRLNDSSWGQASQDQLELYRFNVDFEDPNMTGVEQISIPTTPFDGYPCSAQTGGYACVPQPGFWGLDAIPETIMNIPKYRNFGTHESIVLSFITDVTDGDNLSGIRWVELRRDASTDWYLFQEGTFSPDDGLDRYMPSIALDGKGNIGLAYNVSSKTEHVGLRYTGRLKSDPLGTMTVQEYNVVNGQNNIISGGRFGDYAQMSVDPADESTFWYTTEYGGHLSFSSSTRIVAFELRKDSMDLAINRLVSPGPLYSDSLGTTEQLSIEVQNNGILPMKDYILHLEYEDILIASDTIYTELSPDSTYIHVFEELFDLSEKKWYHFRFTLEHPDDEQSLNNSIYESLLHTYKHHAGIYIQNDSQTCDSKLEIITEIRNFGTDTIQAVDLGIYLNELVVDTVSWNGEILFLEAETIDLSVDLIEEGNNDIEIKLLAINGEIPGSPTFIYSDSTTVDLITNSQYLVLKITTDGFPEETTWDLVNHLGETVMKGGPYTEAKTTIEELFCVNSHNCYTFTIYDSSGDGICCEAGVGRYVMEDGDGDKIFQAFGGFGYDKSHKFCGVEYSCNLSMEYESMDDTGLSNGTIHLSVNNGIEPYRYSIDGGNNFQDSPLFENLMYGDYMVKVEDDSGVCILEDTITVNLSTPTDQASMNETKLKIKPNPNKGYFEFEYSFGASIDPFITVHILDENARIIQSRRFNKYDNTYKGSFSLINYPSGHYYIRLITSEKTKMSRILKQ